MDGATLPFIAWVAIGLFFAACVSFFVGWLYAVGWMLNIRNDKRMVVNFVVPLIFLDTYLTPNGIRYRNRAGLFFLISALLLGAFLVIGRIVTGTWLMSAPWSP